MMYSHDQGVPDHRWHWPINTLGSAAQSAIWQVLSLFLFTPLSPLGLQSHLSGIITLECLGCHCSTHSRVASGGQESSAWHSSTPKDGAHANHMQTDWTCMGEAQTSPAEPPPVGKVCVSPCKLWAALRKTAASKYYKCRSQLSRLLLESKAVEGNTPINRKRLSGATWTVLETRVSTMHRLSSLLQCPYALLFHWFS